MAGVSRCGRKTALAIFFSLSLLAFLFCLLALISPSWQYANLENGRTEHHHGLWLDCKRDYSFDYGRTREYYETLYRRDMQGSPFDIFYLPQLQCVYKFDYYIDSEDLYDHNHDENRIQNDAYQHLFLGWKIAALVGVGVGVLFSATTLLLGICSFCHRTFICACTVLITISAILSTLGVCIFYAWANYQDNKVIKEEDEDEVYEQTLGWAFYAQVIGTILNWICAMTGCCVTSISFSKQRAKLVKIEVVENDQSQLLSSSSSSQAPFKRSFSAIYRVDSAALRQWEADYLRHVREQQRDRNIIEKNNFKRTASVPNFSKKQKNKNRKSMRVSGDFFSSTSNITEFTNSGSNNSLNTQQTSGTAALSTPKQPLKSALKTPIQQRRDVTDVNYEYMPCDSTIGVSTFLGGRTPTKELVGPAYDEVYEQIADTYLEPNSVKARQSTSTLNTDVESARLLPSSGNLASSSQSIPVKQRTTVIDDVARPLSFDEGQKDNLQLHRTREKMIMEEITRKELFKKKPIPPAKPPTPIKPPPKPTALSIRDFGIDMSKQTTGSCQQISSRVDFPTTSSVPTSSTNVARPSSRIFESSDRLDVLRGRPAPPTTYSHQPSGSGDDFPPPPPEIAINTFAAARKSITNLSFRGLGDPAAHIFDRPESVDFGTSSPSTSTQGAPEDVNGPRRPFTSLSQHAILNRRFLNVLPDEVDRSVGSSTLLENDVRDSPSSYLRDAELRLNMFVNDKMAPPSSNGSTTGGQDETTV